MFRTVIDQRVTLFEHTEAGTVHLKNLSIHSASTTDEALNLLFMGDTNRIIAETPMNEASTRSHCIFTIHITSRPHGSSVIRRSKLHLVDLAGSERVYKCGLDGTLLTEAKYINLSLHYLEQVIIALAEKQRTHVPYRNSMMTMMLRDSLGGNCMTSMIATCSIEQENLQETISTCRFAQRVALIKNEITLNEEQDPYLTINHLKSEIEHLKAELAFATGIEKDATLNVEDKENYQKKQKDIPKNYSPHVYTNANIPNHDDNTSTNSQCVENTSTTESCKVQNKSNIEGHKTFQTPQTNTLLDESKRAVDHVTKWLEQQVKGKLLGQLSLGREEAFNIFKQDYPLQDEIDKKKEQLKSLYAEAKLQGSKMSKAKEEVGAIRVQLNSLMQTDQNDSKTQHILTELRNQLELKRTEYRDSYSSLKELKPRVEHLQHSLELAKMRLVQDFESWWNQMSIEQSDDNISHQQRNESISLNSLNDTKNVKLNDTSSVCTVEDKNLSESSKQSYTDSKLNKSSFESVQLTKQINNNPMNYQLNHSIPMTGDPVVDADILTFIRAREKIRSKRLNMDQQIKNPCIE
ncbi:LOW QUALITY PROTEIN: putative krp3 [Schistosoma mansoni]|uniref:putative krp3 n=1 Tax=Schistosoma mansoni TaxID=6183 RepID=UPI00022DC974|nr:LOW QUALITY PROTEIN: putative krp3 [Schistosoma mansoni]|eukprot:XP_018647714.1 LOW QUALITY PROTEIN: putative krp3 [Schistosoma mansoni]